MDGTCSEVSADDATTSGHRGDSELRMVPVVRRHGIVSRDSDMSSNTVYRDSYVDPLRSSSEDERQEDDAPASRSDDTLSDASMLRPVESDTSISSAVSGDATPDPRLSFLGPKTRMISKAPWEEGAVEDEAVSDTEAPSDSRSIFAGKVKKGRSRSRTLTQAKAEIERRFLGGGWGRASTDTRPSMDSSKRSMDSSAASYLPTPISPRYGTFADAARLAARTPSLFSTSSGASSGSGAPPASSGARIGTNRNASGGLTINACGLDSRSNSPTLSSPTGSHFVHPYANPESFPSGHDGEAAASRSNSSTTLTTSTASPYITPSSSTSSATSPGQDDRSAGSKKEKRRPPQLSVSSMNRGPALVNPTKSPSALSTSFVPLSPAMLSTSPAAIDESIPVGMLGFPGSPAYNLISLEQAQQKARERSKSIASSGQDPTSPRPKELSPKKSKPNLVGMGGGFSSMISSGSTSPHWTDGGRARTVSTSSSQSRPRGYTATSLAAQSTTSVNIIGGGIENIPGRANTDSAVSGSTTPESVPARTIKTKRSGFLKFFKDKDKGNSSCNAGNPNISSPSTPIHVAHNTLDAPPVPKLPLQYQTSKTSSPPELESRRDRGLPPVVVSPAQQKPLSRAPSGSDDSRTSIGDHGDRVGQARYAHPNQDNSMQPETPGTRNVPNLNGLKLRPVSSVFNGLPDDYLSSPKTGSGASNSGSRGSSESRVGDSSGLEDSSVLSPATPFFPASARSAYTHVSTASSGSDAFSSFIDPRTPSSTGFPPSVPRSSTDSQSAATIAALREQLEALRKTSRTQISELESQVKALKTELEASKCDRCGQDGDRPTERGITNRPRAQTGTGDRTAPGSSYDY